MAIIRFLVLLSLHATTFSTLSTSATSASIESASIFTSQLLSRQGKDRTRLGPKIKRKRIRNNPLILFLIHSYYHRTGRPCGLLQQNFRAPPQHLAVYRRSELRMRPHVIFTSPFFCSTYSSYFKDKSDTLGGNNAQFFSTRRTT